MTDRRAATVPAPLGQIVLAGAGQMGGAMLAAWIDAGIGASHLGVVEPHPSHVLLDRLTQAGIRLFAPGREGAPADVLVLAVKPQALGEAAAALQGFVGSSTLLISVVAGKTIDDLRRLFPRAAVVARAMPNTPAAIRRGITGVTVEAAASTAQRGVVEQLLTAVGQVEWLPDEALMDAVTAISGSGPAYLFLFVECLAKAGVDLGFEPPVALRLARATVEGAGALMAARPDDDPGQLRRNVTSPGGTTAAALEVLTGGEALGTLLSRATKAAKRRAVELAG